MKYLSLFSGIGGFELGIGDKFECIGYSEINKYSIQVYKKHFNHKNYGDITKISADALPDFELIVGGFPCQSFSIAGKRRGFDDTRGTLFFDIARILKAKKPRLLLLENVKGLLSHDNGQTFKTIIKTITELGYDLQWQVLNSKNFGVPQNRERVFIIGHLRGTPRPKVFPIIGTATKTNKTKEFPEQISNCLRTNYSNGHSNETYIKQINNPKQSNDSDGHDVTVPVLTPDRLNKRQNGRRFKENGDPSFTITAQDIHGIYNGSNIRRLTPKECERLQGFPDDWTKEGTEGLISDTQRYKMCGNAVTVNVIKEILYKLTTK